MLAWSSTHITPAIHRWALETASEAFGVSVKAIESDGRFKEIVGARQYAMWLVRERRNGDGQILHGWEEIGRAFGVHHTTALHAWRAHRRRLRQWATGAEQPPVKARLLSGADLARAA